MFMAVEILAGIGQSPYFTLETEVTNDDHSCTQIRNTSLAAVTMLSPLQVHRHVSERPHTELSTTPQAEMI
jgi:hypothetical protein